MMSALTQVLLALSCVCSCVFAGIYVYIAYQKFKNPKDEIWETALELTKASGRYLDINQFAQTYEQLAFFKSRGCVVNGEHLLQLMQKEELSLSQQHQSGTTH